MISQVSAESVLICISIRHSTKRKQHKAMTMVATVVSSASTSCSRPHASMLAVADAATWLALGWPPSMSGTKNLLNMVDKYQSHFAFAERPLSAQSFHVATSAESKTIGTELAQGLTASTNLSKHEVLCSASVTSLPTCIETNAPATAMGSSSPASRSAARYAFNSSSGSEATLSAVTCLAASACRV